MEAIGEEKVEQVKRKRNDILKAIAIVSMLIDHIGYVFYPGHITRLIFIRFLMK